MHVVNCLTNATTGIQPRISTSAFCQYPPKEDKLRQQKHSTQFLTSVSSAQSIIGNCLSFIKWRNKGAAHSQLSWCLTAKMQIISCGWRLQIVFDILPEVQLMSCTSGFRWKRLSSGADSWGISYSTRIAPVPYLRQPIRGHTRLGRLGRRLMQKTIDWSIPDWI